MMTNLTRFAFVLGFAACGGNVPVGGECEADAECVQPDDVCKQSVCRESACTIVPAADQRDCEPQTDAPLASEVVIAMRADGSAMFARFEDTPAYQDYLAATAVERDRVAIDTCAKREGNTFPLEPFPPMAVGAGNLQIKRDGATVADIAPGADSSYGASLPDDALVAGVPHELVIVGSDVIDANTFGFTPHVAPVLTGTFAGDRLVLEQTLTFEPIAASHVRLVFNISTPTGLETHDCAANGASGSFFIPNPVYDNLSDGGSIAMFVSNVVLEEYMTAAGPRAMSFDVEFYAEFPFLNPQ